MSFASIKMIVGCVAVVLGSIIGIAATGPSTVMGDSAGVIWSIALIIGGMLDLLTSRRIGFWREKSF